MSLFMYFCIDVYSNMHIYNPPAAGTLATARCCPGEDICV